MRDTLAPMSSISRSRPFAVLILVIALSGCSSQPSAPAPQASATVTSTTASAAVEGSPSPAPSVSPTPIGTPAASSTASTSTPAASAPTAAAAPRSPVTAVRAVEVDRGNASGNDIALTINCAANSGPTQQVLDVLAQENVRVTFFLVGIWVRDHQELTKQIAARHEIGSHSWGHPDYRDLTDAEIVADLQQNEDYVFALTGKSMKPLWRAPSGARDNRVIAVAARAGWGPHIFWTIGQDARGTVTGDSGDWRGISTDEVYANTIRASELGGGVITVTHCDLQSTADSLRDTIRAYRAKGLRIVTVSELLRGIGQ